MNTISAWDLVEGEQYILLDSYGNTPFKLLKKTIAKEFHGDQVEGGECVILETMTLDGPQEFMEAKKCYAYGLRIARV